MNFPLFPDQPTALCQNRMQVYSVTQETPDVRTLSLINHDVYPYRPGQFALVNIGQSGACNTTLIKGLFSRFKNRTARFLSFFFGTSHAGQLARAAGRAGQSQ